VDERAAEAVVRAADRLASRGDSYGVTARRRARASDDQSPTRPLRRP
jgi:hypothetical protein